MSSRESACVCLSRAGTIDVLCFISLLYVGAGEPDPGLHSCVASVPTEPSPWTLQVVSSFCFVFMSGLEWEAPPLGPC